MVLRFFKLEAIIVIRGVLAIVRVAFKRVPYLVRGVTVWNLHTPEEIEAHYAVDFARMDRELDIKLRRIENGQ